MCTGAVHQGVMQGKGEASTRTNPPTAHAKMESKTQSSENCDFLRVGYGGGFHVPA